MKVIPTNGQKVRLPSGKVVEGETEVEKTKEIIRAINFGDLVEVKEVKE